MPAALPELLFLALAFFALALAFSAKKITEALFGWLITVLEAIPLIGHTLSGPFRACEQAVTSACGAIISGIEAAVGASFHALAWLTDYLWKQIVAAAAVQLHIAQRIGHAALAVTGLGALLHHLQQVWRGIEHGVRSLERRFHGIEHRVRRLEHELATGIGHDVRSALDTLEHDVNRIRTQTIPAIQGGVAQAEHDVTALGEYVKDHYLANTEEALGVAVAVGLAGLGLGGLRCNSNPWKNNPNACGLFGDLSDLLGLALALGVAVNLEAFVRDCQAIVGATAEAVADAVGAV